jgi:SM-20-related protein
VPGLEFLRALKFLVIEDFLDPDGCRDLCAAMRGSPSVGARTGVVATLDERQRRSRAVSVSPEVRQATVERLDGIRGRASAHFGEALSTLEAPQFLLYRPGDFFIKHMDRDRDGGNERKVSLIAFLNSEFTGGELTFLGGVEGRSLRVTVPPTAGLLLLFRSDWIHQVEPVTAGERYSLVSWFA